MGRFLSTLCVVSAAVITVNSTPLSRRDAADVKKDISDIKSQVSSLDTSISKLSSTDPSLSDALGINTAAGDLQKTVETASDDTAALAKAGNVALDDARAILLGLTESVPAIFKSLSDIVDKKAAFGKLPLDVNSLVVQDLTSIYKDVQPFEAAVLSIAPNHIKDVGAQLTSKIDKAFVSAISAYGGTAAVGTNPAPTTTKEPTSTYPPASVATVQADVKNIGKLVKTLDGALTNFSSSDPELSDALIVDNAAVDLFSALDKSSADVASILKSGKKPTEAEAKDIISSVTDFKPDILSALKSIVSKKSAFGDLPVKVDSLILADLQQLEKDAKSFESGLISAAPSDLQSSASALASSINNAFSTAIAAYQ